jgi:hypothetical protein
MAYVEGKYVNIITERSPRQRDTVLCQRHGWYYDLLQLVPGRSDEFGQSRNVRNAFKLECGCYVMAESDFAICGKKLEARSATQQYRRVERSLRATHNTQSEARTGTRVRATRCLRDRSYRPVLRRHRQQCQQHCLG